MTSSFYECQVMHARFQPRRHRFHYRIFLFALDLDELADLSQRVVGFSVNRRHLYSFCEADFLPTHQRRHATLRDAVAGGLTSEATPAEPGAQNAAPASSLKQRVGGFAAEHGVDLAGGRVLLLTLPRVLGYLFNPVSFYFCYDVHGAPVAAIAEVTNTFREVKPYFLGPDQFRIENGAFRLRVPKHFYVSPFSDVDVAFDFTLRLPGEHLAVQIDDYVGEQRTLTSTLIGRRQPLTSARLAWFTVKYPFITLRVIALIHWHALQLWWKRVPWFAKRARPDDQRDLYRAHAPYQPSDA